MPCKPPSVMARMDKIMNLHKYGEDKERPATNPAHAAASAEASGATKTTVGKATDDGLTSSATTNTQDDEGAIYANRTFHNNVIMRVETEGQHDLKLALNNNNFGNTFGAQNLTTTCCLSMTRSSPPSQPRNPTSASPRTRSNACRRWSLG